LPERDCVGSLIQSGRIFRIETTLFLPGSARPRVPHRVSLNFARSRCLPLFALAAICWIDRQRSVFIPGQRRPLGYGNNLRAHRVLLGENHCARSLIPSAAPLADLSPVRQGKENERSKSYTNRFVESRYPRLSILWTRSTRYPFQYYGRIQHDSGPCIPGSPYTVPSCPVVSRGQSVA